MSVILEVEANSCFPLMVNDTISFKQDAYTLPEPVSPWEQLEYMTAYTLQSTTLKDAGSSFWTVPNASSLQKSDCNKPFSTMVKEKTAELESLYATGMPTLECSDSEWVNMFEYEFHNACPYKWKGIKKWYCMGRRNEEGRLQFAFMHTPPVTNGCTSYNLGDSECNHLNKDIDGISLLLADSDESKSFMLDSKGYLKKAVNPVLLGVISNDQPVTCIENANADIEGITFMSFDGKITVSKESIPGLFSGKWGAIGDKDRDDWEHTNLVANPAIQQAVTTTMLGFVYTIWGTIYKNVLYMVALKLPIPGTGSFLARGTYEGQHTWYRLQTAKGDLYKDRNPYLPGSDKNTPAITAADLCVINGVDKTETFKRLEALGLVDDDKGVVIDGDDGGLAVFYPLCYTTLNVKKFLEWYGSDAELEETISLATVGDGYAAGLKTNWQGDIIMNNSLVGRAGYLNCLVKDAAREENKVYEDMALSFYDSASIKYKYCSLTTDTDDAEADARNAPLYPSASDNINMLLFTYSGSFTTGDPADNLIFMGDHVVTAVAYLFNGPKYPSYEIGGFFRYPSVPCMMGANEFCCSGGTLCADAYSNGERLVQQCGGPFEKYQIGNPKVYCDEYRFGCHGEFLYCAHFKATDEIVAAQWGGPGLIHVGSACGTEQPTKVPYLQYKYGSRPVLVGGSLMGGVNYIFANIKKIGPSYSILISQGHAYNGWNSFYANIGEDITNMVAAEYDPSIRGDLAAFAPEIRDGKTEAMFYNDFAYELPAEPVYSWEDAIVGFCPVPERTGYNAEEMVYVHGDGNGLSVYIHSVDECGRPASYCVEVTGSAMQNLYSTTMATDYPNNLTHSNTLTMGFIQGSADPQSGGKYHYLATTIEAFDFDSTVPASTGISCISLHITNHRSNERITLTDFYPNEDPKQLSLSGIRSLEHYIPIENYETQRIILSAKAKTFQGVDECFILREETGLNPAKTKLLRMDDEYGIPTPVKTTCWYYLDIHKPGFIRCMKAQRDIVQNELKITPEGRAYEWSATSMAQARYEVEVTEELAKDIANNGGELVDAMDNTLRRDDNGKYIFSIHGKNCGYAPATTSIIINRNYAYLHRTDFEVWTYDENTYAKLVDENNYAPQDSEGNDIPPPASGVYDEDPSISIYYSTADIARIVKNRTGIELPMYGSPEGVSIEVIPGSGPSVN